jgi:hypothetical protein
MLNRVRSLVAVLVLGLPVVAGAQPKAEAVAPPTAKPAVKVEDPTSTFLKQEKYTYCDVKILAEYWKTSTKEAKATAGSKLQANATPVLDSALDQARAATKLKCTYLEGGFTFKDVQKLSKLWHLSTAEAKSTIELKLMHGTSIYLKEEIRNSAAQENDPYSVFSNQAKYTYCDARMIGNLWGKSMAEGKKAIGQKLVAKNTKGLTKLVADARKNAKKNVDARCSYYDAGMSYEDLMILAKLWKKPEGDMKALVAEKFALGQEATVLAQLKKEKAKQAKLKPKDETVQPARPPMQAPVKQDTVPSQYAPASPPAKPATKQATPPAPAPAPTKAAPAPAPTKAG